FKRAFFNFSLQLTGLDALYTHRAFFHYPTETCSNIRIKHQVCMCVDQVVIKACIVPVIEPVKGATLEWTVISAITYTNTRVISHMVNPFGRVYSSQYRTNGFARCMVAM